MAVTGGRALLYRAHPPGEEAGEQKPGARPLLHAGHTRRSQVGTPSLTSVSPRGGEGRGERGCVCCRNPQTLVEVTSFAAINKFQPFNVAISSNVLLLLVRPLPLLGS